MRKPLERLEDGMRQPFAELRVWQAPIVARRLDAGSPANMIGPFRLDLADRLADSYRHLNRFEWLRLAREKRGPLVSGRRVSSAQRALP